MPDYTKVDPEMFVTPVKRLGVSGGTAPFFELKLTEYGRQHLGPPGSDSSISETYYIGKDLSRAEDEIAFYEGLLKLKRSNGKKKGFEQMIPFTFEYAGVLTTLEKLEEGAPPSDPLNLLVLRNLRDETTALRLLDLKMGSKTAVAGWQGKSRIAAMRQSVVDSMTNSTTEGYRLEGFDGPPKTLRSRDPLLDMGTEKKADEATKKKAKRMLYQSLHGDDIFMHLLDLRGDASTMSSNDGTERYTSSEMAEIFLHEILQQLIRLSLSCHNLQLPQKWIGSSVAIGFDVGLATPIPPVRSQISESELRSKVIVQIFDWGRSELNDPQSASRLNSSEKQNRAKYWKYYTNGIDHLSYSALHSYVNRFGCRHWTDVIVEIRDYDSVMGHEVLGRVVLKLEEVQNEKIDLLDCGGNKTGVSSAPKSNTTTDKPTITLSISWKPISNPTSRLSSSWQIHIHSASNLPRMDRLSPSDPYCVIQPRFEDGERCQQFMQLTSVKENTENPVWDEVVEIPVGRDPEAQIRKGIAEGGGEEFERRCNLDRGELFGCYQAQGGAGKKKSGGGVMACLIGTSTTSSTHIKQWSKTLSSFKSFS